MTPMFKLTVLISERETRLAASMVLFSQAKTSSMLPVFLIERQRNSINPPDCFSSHITCSVLRQSLVSLVVNIV